jgi:hypothetical protein
LKRPHQRDCNEKSGLPELREALAAALG